MCPRLNVEFFKFLSNGPDRSEWIKMNLFQTRITQLLTSQFLGLVRYTSPEHFERLMSVESFLLLGFSERHDCATSFRTLLVVHLIHRFVRSARYRGIERRKRTGFHFTDFALLRVVADVGDNRPARRFRSILNSSSFFLRFSISSYSSNKAT